MPTPPRRRCWPGSRASATGLAQNIVAFRDANGPFRSRTALKEVPRLGPKAFEQCAGFLRIPGGDDPLDASGVHPEAYPVVRRIVEAAKIDIKGLIGNATVLRALSPKSFVDETFGLPTVTDILRELEKPGPRSAAGVQGRRPSWRASKPSRTSSPAWCWKAR